MQLSSSSLATCVLTPAGDGTFVSCHHLWNVHEKNGKRGNAPISQRVVFPLALSPITHTLSPLSQPSFLSPLPPSSQQDLLRVVTPQPISQSCGFPWLPGSWCLDTLRDALQLICGSSFYHTHPSPSHLLFPPISSVFTAGSNANTG